MNNTAEITELLKCDSKTPRFSYNGIKTLAKCVSVYDGDTAQLVFRSFPGGPFCRYTCRMTGYNSAEIKGNSAEEKEAAKLARNALSEYILGKVFTVHLGDFDKYGRPLVDIYVGDANNSIHVNAKMIELGYGKPYTGSGDKLW